MANPAFFQFLTAKGIADPGQDPEVARLKQRLAQPGAKLLLHLHGGLVDEAAGKAAAARLSGSGPHAFNAGPDWTQVYIVWRTGAFEEIKRNWLELLENDKLYKAIVRKLISYVARRLALPAMQGRSAAQEFPLDDTQILQRMLGQGDRREPFADIDTHLAQVRDTGSRALLAPERTSGELVVEFSEYLAEDALFQAALADINAAANAGAPGRGPAPAGAVESGEKMIERLDPAIAAPLQPPPAGVERGAVPVGITIVKHALAVALRVFERFRHHRDHGLHATIVEEVCREFYADRIGATIWGWMVRDAALHFGPGGFGNTLLDALPDRPDLPIAVTAHSAGSIWASQMLLAMDRAQRNNKINLCLLAPAVRDDLFATALAASAGRIGRCHMYTMTDALERRDAVLGHDWGYVYPSSLLYLVSGMFEKCEDDPYVDAPLVGMQRYVQAAWLTPAEAGNAAAIAGFFMQPDKGISWSPDATTDADSHGGFDDNQLTLESVKAQFLTP